MANFLTLQSLKSSSSDIGVQPIKTVSQLPVETPDSKILLQRIEKEGVLVIKQDPEKDFDEIPVPEKEEAIPEVESSEPKITISNDSFPKRQLPDEIKQHFENNSASFISFARQKESSSVLGDAEKQALWDRALLSEEFLDGRIPLEIGDESKKGVSFVPKKPEQTLGGVFPTRVVSETLKGVDDAGMIVSRPPKNIKTVEKTGSAWPEYVPKKPGDVVNKEKYAVMNSAVEKSESAQSPVFEKPIHIETPNEKEREPGLGIPKKPKTQNEPLVVSKNNTPEKIDAFIVAQKKALTLDDIKKETIPEAEAIHILKKTEIGDSFEEKIIDVQMRTIFENAPGGVRSQMEKMLAKELLTEKDQNEDLNNIWKKRLRDYILKLKEQGKGVFEEVGATEPKEGETVLDYIRRIYLSIVRAEVLKNAEKQ